MKVIVEKFKRSTSVKRKKKKKQDTVVYVIQYFKMFFLVTCSVFLVKNVQRTFTSNTLIERYKDIKIRWTQYS